MLGGVKDDRGDGLGYIYHAIILKNKGPVNKYTSIHEVKQRVNQNTFIEYNFFY